jgi:hypothetical protein
LGYFIGGAGQRIEDKGIEEKRNGEGQGFDAKFAKVAKFREVGRGLRERM